MKTIINEVPYWVFNELVEKCEKLNVDLFYNGSASRGTVTLDHVTGNIKDYKKALKIFVSIYVED